MTDSDKKKPKFYSRGIDVYQFLSDLLDQIEREQKEKREAEEREKNCSPYEGTFRGDEWKGV